jgi:RimJ/RimL family protein N-acetyltransferase
MCIGGFCFKGPANIAGHTEIGYGLLPRYRGKGFMTEAVERLVAWAFETPAIKAITAETPKDNVPSHRVLIRCGFTRYMQTEHSLFWKTAKPDGKQ